MSSHSTHSSISPDSTSDGESNRPPLPTAAAKLQKLSGRNRAQTSLSNPQSARSPGTVGATTLPLRGRGTRSPVQPLISSPLRIASSAMASAPSSPERPKAGADDLPRRSSDQFTRETGRRASTGHASGLQEDVKSKVSPSATDLASRKRSVQPRDKQGRSAMAAVMSGLESRLFPKSFTRGRDTSRSSSRRGSSLDSRSLSSASLPSRSISPSTQRLETGSKSTIANTDKGKAIKMEDAHNKSDEALAKPPGGLPDYVKPSEQEDSGERLAKDVFDRDKNMIESSEDTGDELTSDDEQIPGHKKKGSDISTITPSDFNKPKTAAERMSFDPFGVHSGSIY